MKRDMELVRKILLAVEEATTTDKPIPIKLEGYDLRVISYHIQRLHEAGLIEALDASDLGTSRWHATSLTWAGHEFLDTARNDTVWQRAMTSVNEKGGSVSLEVLKSILTSTVLQLFGLGG
jgi:Hypothetical protein (DUF2513)